MMALADLATSLRRDFGLLTEDELAVMLDLKLETIRAWRSEKIGPAWVKLGKGVYYRFKDITEWIDKSVVPMEAAT
jgi:hypothetical protein